MENEMAQHEHARRRSPTFVIGLLAAAALLAFLLLKGHGYHVLAYAPLLILVACPFLHMGMHGRHGHGAHEQPPAADEPPQQPKA